MRRGAGVILVMLTMAPPPCVAVAAETLSAEARSDQVLGMLLKETVARALSHKAIQGKKLLLFSTEWEGDGFPDGFRQKWDRMLRLALLDAKFNLVNQGEVQEVTRTLRTRLESFWAQKKGESTGLAALHCSVFRPRVGGAELLVSRLRIYDVDPLERVESFHSHSLSDNEIGKISKEDFGFVEKRVLRESSPAAGASSAEQSARELQARTDGSSGWWERPGVWLWGGSGLLGVSAAVSAGLWWTNSHEADEVYARYRSRARGLEAPGLTADQYAALRKELSADLDRGRTLEGRANLFLGTALASVGGALLLGWWGWQSAPADGHPESSTALWMGPADPLSAGLVLGIARRF